MIQRRPNMNLKRGVRTSSCKISGCKSFLIVSNSDPAPETCQFQLIFLQITVYYDSVDQCRLQETTLSQRSRQQYYVGNLFKKRIYVEMTVLSRECSLISLTLQALCAGWYTASLMTWAQIGKVLWRYTKLLRIIHWLTPIQSYVDTHYGQKGHKGIVSWFLEWWIDRRKGTFEPPIEKNATWLWQWALPVTAKLGSTDFF